MTKALVTMTAAFALLATCAMRPCVATAEPPSGSSVPQVAEEGFGAPRGDAPALFRSELEQPDTLGVGRIAKDVAKHLPELEAMAEYLDGRTAVLGYSKVRPVIARDNAEMIDFLRRGIVDVVSETPLSAIHFVRAAGASIILRERRKGHAGYSSIVFVRADSPIRTLADLRDHRVAFEDPGSTTAFLLPLAAIKRAGLRTVALAGASAPPPEDGIGYFFTRSEASIVTVVTRRVADVGALSDEEWQNFRSRDPDAVKTLRVIHESERVPRAFVLTGPMVSARQREALRTLLLSMDDDDEGRAVLERYNQVAGFDPIDGRIEGEIEGLESTYDLVREELD